MHPALKRNFEVFSALDWLAALAWGGRAGSRRVQAGAVRIEAAPEKQILITSYHPITHVGRLLPLDKAPAES